MILQGLLFSVLAALIWQQPANQQLIREVKALETLRIFVDRDLTKLDIKDSEALSSAVQALCPKRRKNECNEAPRSLWEFKKTGENSCFVFLEAFEGGFHPGTSYVRLTLIDQTGKSLFDCSFTTGHRCYLKSIGLNQERDESPLIKLWTDSIRPGGPEVKTQYYAKIGDRIDLIRVENSDGSAARNSCVYKHFRSGPPAPLQSADRWEADLNSRDRMKILRALTWLGSEHRPADMQLGGGELEPKADIDRLHILRSRPSVTARLRVLFDSKDEWIWQAAALALHPKDRG